MKVLMTDIETPDNALRAEIDEDKLAELAHSINQQGLLQPIGLKKGRVKKWQIVFGHRRFLAHEFLKRKHIEANEVAEPEGSTAEFAKLIENTVREDLTPMEEAQAIFSMMQAEALQPAEIARATGKSLRWVMSRLNILDFPEDVQVALHAGVIKLGVAQAMATITDDGARRYYLEAAINSGCTESQATIWAQAANMAADGVARAARSQEELEAMGKEPPRVEQVYNCFCCGKQWNWRRISLLTICPDGMEWIASERDRRKLETATIGYPK